MPTLSSLRKERFCRLLAEGELPVHAFVKAGYSPKGAQANSYKLKNQPIVRERVAEIVQGKIRAGQKIPSPGSNETLTPGEWDWAGEVPVSYMRRRIVAIADKAEMDGDHTAALAAIKLLGQTVGMFDAKGKPMTPGQIGRPRTPEEPNTFTKEKRHADRQTQVNVQIVNQVSRNVGGGVGDDAAEGNTVTLDAIATVASPLLDYRPGVAVPGRGGDEGEVREGVPCGTRSSGTE